MAGQLATVITVVALEVPHQLLWFRCFRYDTITISKDLDGREHVLEAILLVDSKSARVQILLAKKSRSTRDDSLTDSCFWEYVEMRNKISRSKQIIPMCFVTNITSLYLV